MSKFASGIKKRQGGDTGSNHWLCGKYGAGDRPARLLPLLGNTANKWIPYAQKLPSADPVKDEFRAEFEAQMEVLKSQLDAMEMEEEGEVILASLK